MTNLVLIYEDENGIEIIGEITTNHNITVAEALDLIGVDMKEWAEEMGWEDYDYNCLELRTSKEE